MTKWADRLPDRYFHAFTRTFRRRTFLPRQYRQGLATFRAHRRQLPLAAHSGDSSGSVTNVDSQLEACGNIKQVSNYPLDEVLPVVLGCLVQQRPQLLFALLDFLDRIQDQAPLPACPVLTKEEFKTNSAISVAHECDKEVSSF